VTIHILRPSLPHSDALVRAIDTTITFEGTTTFGFAEWAGPLISVAGTNITVSGGTLDGQGQLYWDGQGSNGGISACRLYPHTSMV
jgi:hypothetical protein